MDSQQRNAFGRIAHDHCEGGFDPSGTVRYIALVPEGDVVSTLSSQIGDTLALLRGLPASVSTYRYAPDKWSIKQVLGHLSDSERVFAYRALRIGRGDTTPLPSFDERAYATAMQAGERTVADLVQEWGAVRQATLALFRHLPASSWQRRGIASDHPISVRALAYVIAGHVRHHFEVLDARYRE